MKMKKTTLAAALAVTTAFAGSAFAQRTPDAGWYAGLSIGQSEADGTCSGIVGLNVSCDDKDTAWKIFGGYQINRTFAAEFGYTDLGEVTASVPGASAKVESTAWELVGIGALPVGERFSLYGKLGLYRAETEFSATGLPRIKEDNTDLTYGFGVRYDFARNFGVRAEWQRYSDVGGGQIGEDDIDVLSIGAIWRF